MEFGDSNQPKVDIPWRGSMPLHVDITLNKFHFDLPELNFFRTSNIFSPGKRLMNITDIMLPYDLVLLGQIETPK